MMKLTKSFVNVDRQSGRILFAVALAALTGVGLPAQQSSASNQSSRQQTGQSADQTMEFTDKPDFTVAGVTDWTAAGGHGSDTVLRTSEDLARETQTLKPPEASGASVAGTLDRSREKEFQTAFAHDPRSFAANRQLGSLYLQAGKYVEAAPYLQTAYDINPEDDANELDLSLAFQASGNFKMARRHVARLLLRNNTADLHRLAGELDEQLGDPLGAVQNYEQAVQLGPTEPNYFAWGSELLLHRAVWQAVEVFRSGAKTYPGSARMTTALGAALFAGARYDEAALRFCDASEIDPMDPGPYLFMGRAEIEAPNPLPCVERNLAQFVRRQPENANANYYYAMALWKRQPAGAQAIQAVEDLLTRAVVLDGNCGEAYLQLGIVYSSLHKDEKAIELYRKALEVKPQLGEAHYRLGVAYAHIGDAAQAKREFELHDRMEKEQAAEIERERRSVKQFLVVLQNRSAGSRQID